jgi:hypothetical protein
LRSSQRRVKRAQLHRAKNHNRQQNIEGEPARQKEVSIQGRFDSGKHEFSRLHAETHAQRSDAGNAIRATIGATRLLGIAAISPTMVSMPSVARSIFGNHLLR